MEQVINNKTEKVKEALKQKGKVVLEWVLIVTFLVFEIYFLFKPLMEFMFMIEYEIKLTILKYFTG
jgi:hypothetical protein